MNIAVVLAGGTGSRMGNIEKPKQFIMLSGKPVIVYSLLAFCEHPMIDSIFIVCSKEWRSHLNGLIAAYKINKVKGFVEPGSTRSGSSWNALQAIKKTIDSGTLADSVVLIHDSARPLVTEKIITENIEAAKSIRACETAIPVENTIVRSVDGKKVTDLFTRNELFSVQTPQSFNFNLIFNAYSEYFTNDTNQQILTDDCSLLLLKGQTVDVVQGSKSNMKLTTKEDLSVLEMYIQNNE